MVFLIRFFLSKHEDFYDRMSNKPDTSFQFIFFYFNSLLLIFSAVLHGVFLFIPWNLYIHYLFIFFMLLFIVKLSQILCASTHLSELPNRTVRCLAFLALRSDDMSVRILLSHDFSPRLGNIRCGIGVFRIVWKIKKVFNYFFAAGFKNMFK